MSAGMIPALDLPGDATPGQLGPTMRVVLPRSLAYAQKAAVSCTGIPSVITITSGIRASIASITASLVPAGGTNTTETSAPVCAIASATVPNTGTLDPLSSMVWPALRGLVPPTTFVSAAIIRAPCLRPSDPVMPWTMIRLSLVRKIAMSYSRRGQAGQLGSPPGRVIHRPHLLDHRNARLGQYPPPLGGVVAVKPHHDRTVDRLAAIFQHANGGHDPVGHLVARGNAAENVHEHRPDRRVGQHDLQAIGHHLGRGAAADVEEVSRPHAAELLARVGDHVERRHHQAGPVADDADLSFELDVVEVLLFRARLDRIGGAGISEPGEVLPEGGVVVQADLAVERGYPSVRGQRHRVDLDQRGVLVGEHRPQPGRQLDRAVCGLRGNAASGDDLGGLGAIHAG